MRCNASRLVKTMNTRSLKLRQLDTSLQRFRSCLDKTPPPKGWIQEIRTALGMTTRQFAQRLGKNQSTITRLERSEADGKITLSSLSDLADGLNCRLVYAIVPKNEGLEDWLRQRIREVAKEFVSSVSNSMALEDQAVSVPFKEAQLAELVDELMKNPPSNLWEPVSTSR